MVSFFSRLRTYLKVAQTLPLLRRYVVLGMFDGIIVTLSLIATADIGKLATGALWTAAIGSLVGIATASAWNTIQAELLERAAELRKIERTLLRSLKGTVLERAHKISMLLCALVHAVSPLTGLLLVILYLHLKSYSITSPYALPITTVVAGSVLGVLGIMYLGELEKSDVAKLSLLMSSATIGVVIILLLVMKVHELGT